MSIKDIVAGLENRVDNLFTHADPVDPATLRGPVLQAIADAEAQWASRGSNTEHDWFSESNGSVAFSPRLANGAPLTIDGLTTNFIPTDRFADYLANMRRAVDAGEFDAEIAGGMGNSPNVSGLATVAMPNAHQGTSDGSREAQRTGSLHAEERSPDRVLGRDGEHGSDKRPNDRIA